MILAAIPFPPGRWWRRRKRLVNCHPDMLLVGIQRLKAVLEKALDPD